MGVCIFMQKIQVSKQGMHNQNPFKGHNPRRAGNRSMESMHCQASRRAESTDQSPPHLVRRHHHRGDDQPTLDLANAGPRHEQAPDPPLRNPARLIRSLRTPHLNPLGGDLRPSHRPTHVKTLHQPAQRPKLQRKNGDRTSHLVYGDIRRRNRGAKEARKGGNARRDHVGYVADSAVQPGWLGRGF